MGQDDKKIQKTLTQKIMNEVEHNYDYSQTLDVPIEEIIGIENQQPSGGIRNLSEMASHIKNFHFDNRKKPYKEIVDPELQFIDKLLDDQILNNFIAPDNYFAPHKVFELIPPQVFN